MYHGKVVKFSLLLLLRLLFFYKRSNVIISKITIKTTTVTLISLPAVVLVLWFPPTAALTFLDPPRIRLIQSSSLLLSRQQHRKRSQSQQWLLPPPPPKQQPEFVLSDDESIPTTTTPTTTTPGNNSVVHVPTMYGLLECIPITITIPVYNRSNTNQLMKVMTTTIVEATATTQNQLVDYVLLLQPPPPPNIVNENNITIERPLQDPYGAVLWPAAQAVASYILSHFSSDSATTNDNDPSTGGLDLLFHHTIHPSLRTTVDYTMATNTANTAIVCTPNIRRTQIIELGCGTGLISLSLYHQAMQFIQNYNALSASNNTTTKNTPAVVYDISIIATDYEVLPLQLVQYAATTLTQNTNDVVGATNISTILPNTTTTKINRSLTYTYDHHKVTFQTQLFDICDMSQPIPMMTLHHDDDNDDSHDDDDDDPMILIVVADILYDQSTALALAQRIIQIRSSTVKVGNISSSNHNNIHIIVGDSPGRLGRPIFLQELQRYYDHQYDKNDSAAAEGAANNTTTHPTFLKTTLVMGQTITTPRNELICGPTSTTISRPNDPQPIEIDILHI